MNNILQDTIEHYKKIMSFLPGHVYCKDRQGIFVWCNDLQLKDMGLKTLEEYIGKTDLDLFPKEESEVFRKHDLEVMETGIPQVFEETVLNDNGETVIYLSQKVPLKDENNKVIGLVGISFDITTIKTKEYKLEEKEIALDNILINLPGHVYWKDRNFIYRGCNETQAKSAGFSREEVNGKTDYDMPWKADADILRKYDAQVMSTGETITSEEPSTLASGKEAIFLSKKIPLRDKQNNIVGILGISFDITAEKEAEKLRFEKALHEEQESVMRLLVSSMAHELRTPLSSIQMGTEGIESYLPDLLAGYQLAKDAGLKVPLILPMQLKSLNKVIKNLQKEARSAFSIIDMLLINTNTLQIDKGQFKVCSIAQCIDDALVRYPFQEDEVDKIHWNKSDFSFMGEELLMAHVVFNLLKNALYYLRAANKGEIHIWCEQGETFNILHFKDTGLGIEADVLPHIFDRFYSRTRKGTGVGLAFCKLVLESFGGSITCQSVKGEYTDFTMTFPRIK